MLMRVAVMSFSPQEAAAIAVAVLLATVMQQQQQHKCSIQQ
jgi:hypothetical protein